MKARLQSPNAQDEFYLIKKEEFMSAVDQHDLDQTNSQTIEDAYHIYWFDKDQDGNLLFYALEFYLTKGVVKFINGRHRTLLLAKYLKEIPMALTNMDFYPIYAGESSLESTNGVRAPYKLIPKAKR